MKKFIFKSVLFLVVSLIPILLVLSMADGYSDPHYLKFTTQRQANLIIGTSRAGYGLIPSVIDSVLQQKFPQAQIYNYAFARNYSPYGEAYYESIKKKLAPGTKGGIFIVTVDPWMLSQFTADTLDYYESHSCVAQTSIVNMYPNVEYLYESFENRYWMILKGRTATGPWLLHNDGWLETFANMHEDSVRARTKMKLYGYEMMSGPAMISSVRVNYFAKTIDFLQQHGSVYLFRMPIDAQIRANEELRFPGYQPLIEKIAAKYHVPYVDLFHRPDTLRYIDGDHLWPASARQVSIEVANSVLKPQ